MDQPDIASFRVSVCGIGDLDGLREAGVTHVLRFVTIKSVNPAKGTYRGQLARRRLDQFAHNGLWGRGTGGACEECFLARHPHPFSSQSGMAGPRRPRCVWEPPTTRPSLPRHYRSPSRDAGAGANGGRSAPRLWPRGYRRPWVSPSGSLRKGALAVDGRAMPHTASGSA